MVLGVLIAALVIAALISLQGKILLLIIPLVVYLLVGVLWMPAKAEVVITRTLSSTRVFAGDPVDCTVTVSNTGKTLANVVFSDQLGQQMGTEAANWRWRGTLFAGQTQTLSYRIHPARGQVELSPVTLQYSDPLGLIQRTQTVAIPAQLLVQPNIEQVKAPPIQPRNTLVYAGNIRAQTAGSGVEFFGVRDFQPGDSRRHINWRLSSKGTQRMYTNAFEQERVADVGIILDARARSAFAIGGESLFEYSVLAAGALADAYSRDGNRVGLLQYGRLISWTFPGYGKQQRLRILNALSTAKTGDSQVFDMLKNIPTQLFPRNSQLVFVSPFWTDDIEMVARLRGIGYKVLVVSPSPIAFETQFLPQDAHLEQSVVLATLERRLLFKKILQAGAQVIDWDVRQPLAQQLNRRQLRAL